MLTVFCIINFAIYTISIAIIAATIEPAIEPSQAQVETTETSAKPSVLGPRPITSIASPQLSGSSKPALTAANIIKVTPRPLIGSKGKER